ncbi:hypothetical protein FQN57_001633 [Myotisia sp. PD_48]|nr:hypothetical protein FQN57_001633 [Myotisia sp. PD_48]
MADPFEVRMRFTTQLQHLSASFTSSQKAANYVLKHRDMGEDLHSCIIEQLERNNMNNRANIIYFIEHLCDVATKENHLEFVRMIQRDILRIVDAVTPSDGSGAANVKHVRRVLNGLQSKEILSHETISEIDASLKERESYPAHLLDGAEEEGDLVQGVKTDITVDKKQIEQRVEEDRERNKRLRENMWAVPPNDMKEFEKMWDDTSDIGEDDYLQAAEEADERRRAAEALGLSARGLFTRPEGTETHHTESPPEPTTPAMVRATRSTVFARDDSSRPTQSPVPNGKRKETPSSTSNIDSRPQKRQRARPSSSASKSGTSTPVPATENDVAPKSTRYQVLDSVTITSKKQDSNFGSDSQTPVPEIQVTRLPMRPQHSAHLRFGSEEPTPLTNGNDDQLEEDPANGIEHDGDDASDDNSSDDEAPEAFSNAAQQVQLREEERKKEETWQMLEQLRREKRREHEKRLKLQASSKAAVEKTREAIPQAQIIGQDEVRSDSSVTLQALETRDFKFSGSLPTLLPDEILNADPSSYNSLVAVETDDSPRFKSRKHISFDKPDKTPKDIRVGSTAIRVLGQSAANSNYPNRTLHHALPPKTSTTSKRVREQWVVGKRKAGATGALRQSSGPTSFVRG